MAFSWIVIDAVQQCGILAVLVRPVVPKNMGTWMNVMKSTSVCKCALFGSSFAVFPCVHNRRQKYKQKANVPNRQNNTNCR